MQEGLLRASRGPSIDGYHKWCFHKMTLATFVKSVTGACSQQKCSGDVISFYKALRRCSSIGLTVVDLIRAIQSGHIGVRESKRSSLVFRWLEINSENFEGFIRVDKQTVEWNVSIERAARILKLNDQAARDLVRAGCLPTVTEFSKGRDRRVVPLSSINQFKHVYISASEIAVRMRTSPRNAVMKLERDGVTATTGPGIDGSRQYFFMRQDVKRAGDTLFGSKTLV